MIRVNAMKNEKNLVSSQANRRLQYLSFLFLRIRFLFTLAPHHHSVTSSTPVSTFSLSLNSLPRTSKEKMLNFLLNSHSYPSLQLSKVLLHESICPWSCIYNLSLSMGSFLSAYKFAYPKKTRQKRKRTIPPQPTTPHFFSFSQKSWKSSLHSSTSLSSIFSSHCNLVSSPITPLNSPWQGHLWPPNW